MALFFHNKEIIGVNFGNKAVTAIYKGAKVIWEAALRIWKGTQIWKSSETWKY